MERKPVAIVSGIFIWYLLIIVRLTFLVSPGINNLLIDYSLTLLFTILTGFVVALISQERKFLVAASTILLAYVPLAIVLGVLGSLRGHQPSRPTFLSLSIVGVILVAMALLGALLAILLCKIKRNRR